MKRIAAAAVMILLAMPAGAYFADGLADGQYAQLAASDISPIGTVSAQAGYAWATRINGTRVKLEEGSAIYQDDVVETGNLGSVVIVFVDATTFSPAETARMVIDELVYDAGGSSNQASFSLLQCLLVMVMVSGDVAASGEMNVITLVSTIGIRG